MAYVVDLSLVEWVMFWRENSNFLQLYSTQMTEMLDKVPSKLFQTFPYINTSIYIYILKIGDLNSQSLLDLHDLFDLKTLVFRGN